MIKRAGRAWAVLAAVVITVVPAGCGQRDPAGADPGSGGPVVIGIDTDQPGLGLKVGADYQGFEVDVARYVGTQLGYTDIVFRSAPADQRESLLESGQVKMIFADYTITDERAVRVSFAGPYYVAGADLLVGKYSDLTGPKDLNGQRLCAVPGTSEAKTIQDRFAPRARVHTEDSLAACIASVRSGSSDAVSADDLVLAGYAALEQNHGKVRVVGQPFSTERYGVGVAKGATKLCGQINTALQRMITDTSWQAAYRDSFSRSTLKLDHSRNPPSPTTCT